MDDAFEILRDPGDLIGIGVLIFLAIREYFHLATRRDELKAKQEGSPELRALSEQLDKLTDHLVEQNRILRNSTTRGNE